MKYHDITKDDMKNGDGLRAVLWVSGCSHKCEGCQNPLTWDPEDGLEFDENACEELLVYLSRDYVSGLTLSGGDPLFEGNREDVLKLVKAVKEALPDKTIWLYTGYNWETVKDIDIMNYVDVCIDGRFDIAKKDNKLHWKGSSNQRTIDVKKSIRDNNIILYSE